MISSNQTKSKSKSIKWKIAKLGTVCTLIGGGTPSRRHTEYFGGSIPWLTPTEISKTKIKLIHTSREKITNMGLRYSSAKLVPAGAVLLTTRASIGYVGVAGTQVTTNQGFVSFVCSDAVYNYYLAYWLVRNRKLLNIKARGTTFKEISRSIIRDLDIPLPPLAEQKRIVAKLESIFTNIDSARSYLKMNQVLLGQAQRSALKGAFEGRLVSQDPKDEPASILLERVRTEQLIDQPRDNYRLHHTTPIKNSAYINIKLPHGWSRATLEQISLVTPGQSPPSSSYNQNQSGLPFFQGKANFGVLYPTPQYWCECPIKIARKNDILISVRAPIGPTNLSRETCCIGRGLSSIRVFDNFQFKYVLYHIRAIENNIASIGTGTTFKAITNKQLKSIVLNIAPVAEQKRIVTKLESIFIKIDLLTKQVECAMNQLNALEGSTLKLAFDGKLVPQYPSDKPVTILETIQQSKRLTKPANPRRGK